MKEQRLELGQQVFTDDQLERMAKELIVKALGIATPSLSQMDTFINTLIKNKAAMKGFVRQAERIINEEYMLVKFEGKTLKN